MAMTFNISNNKNQIIAVVSVILVSLVIYLSILSLTNANIYIKNTGTTIDQNGRLANSITVTSDGKVFAKPDMATINISISQTAQTSKDALSKINNLASQITNLLTSNSVSTNDIKTSQLSLYPEYNYDQNSIKDQRATISITAMIKNLDATSSRLTAIVDQVSQINNVMIGSIQFDVENKDNYYSQARVQALNSAKAKATELAQLSGVKLLSPISISEDVSKYAPQPIYNIATLDAKTTSNSGATNTISSGQMEINLHLNLIYGIQ